MQSNLKKMDRETIKNIKEINYFRIIILIFLICILSGEVVDLLDTIITGNWDYYFTIDRIIDSIDLYIFQTIAFTIIIIFKTKRYLTQQ